ncbi:hypothetical protein ACQY0O_003355 [Thecaphora frezii]
MSQFSNRKGAHGSTISSTINQKAALASAYQELGKELSSGKLKAVGNYTLQRPIGEGTYGKVRLGLHRLTNTRVAIKQIPKAHSASLTREIHHHRRLHHPNVMKLYEVIATEQYIWMVSELCAGGELYDYLVEREYLPEAEARRIFGQLCLAVAYIHGKGIVHRDLKLENVLLDERCNVKLGDFGFTREFEGKKLMDTFCGTTGYAAPEMLAGKRYTGQEVDVWSLGIILYALLCGALPFDDDDETVMKAKILKGEYEVPECISQEAKDLLNAILQLDPLKRPTIHAILSHAWFSKVIVSTPMTPLEENASAHDYFQSEALSESMPEFACAVNEGDLTDSDPAGPEAQAGGASAGSEGPASPAISATGMHPKRTATQGNSPPVSPVSDLPDGVGHQVYISGTSESSFYSARSDSESSDRRSSTTDITDPNTADVYLKSENLDEAVSSDLPTHADITPSGLPGVRAKLPRNESQSTIRRAGSNGSDASYGAGIRSAAAKSASSSLPTHHESPNMSDRESAENATSVVRSTSLQKRSSQGSSRGHHRTPSRTKRRSVSSGGLSDHHPPPVGSRPVDYVAQLTQAQPAMFSSALEQNLLHQLSGLGVDVGQMVHSICTDACDASGALWWMLVRKAQERESAMSPALETAASTPPHASPLSAAAAESAMTPHPPPPLPQKDPSRHSQERHRSSLAASKSMDSTLLATPSRLQTVISQEEMDAGRGRRPSATIAADASAGPSLKQSSSTSTPASLKPISILSEAVSEHASPSKTRSKDHHQMPTTPSSLGSVKSHAEEMGSPGTPKAKRQQHADRARSNSLSMKQFASTVLGTREKSPQPEQVCIAGETLPLERSKSPSIFGKRTSSAGGTREPTSIASKLAVAPPPKKMSLDAASPDRSRKSLAKRPGDFETAQRTKDTEKGDIGVGPPSRFVDDVKATPFASVDSFSTTSLTPQSTGRSTKQKPGSSFMATVRTWLGAHEKQSSRKQQKSGKKVSKAGTSSLGYDGPASASQLSNRQGSTRKRGGPYHPPAMTRRPSKPSQMGSLSRRSSTGSSKHFNLDIGGPSNQQYGRPSTLRRLSAGSITPTGTLYGDYMQEHVSSHGRTPSRSSRPSSGHSQQFAGLQGRKGSASSASSAFKMRTGSSYSSSSGRRQAHRLSYDGGTVVRRHRAYNSSSASPSRRNSRHDSRPGSLRSRNSSPGRIPIEGATEELDDFGRSIPSDLSTPRRSLEASSRRPSSLRNETPSGRQSPLSTETGGRAPGHQHHSIFVAHKSRTPYKPPSASSALHGSHARSQYSSVSSFGPSSVPGYPPAAGTGTWRHSWGRPPPSWAGPVDPPPPSSNDSTMFEREDSRTKLRDVFANKDGDDDWTDEDDEPAYSGGLGQLDSLNGGWSDFSSLNRGEAIKGSPYATRVVRGYGGNEVAQSPNSMSSRFNNGLGGSGGVLGYGRYAGVRSLFQSPSLSNDFSPQAASVALNGDADAPRPSTDTGGESVSDNGSTEAVASPALSTGGSRIRARSAAGTSSAFKGNDIVEEEEEEE